MSFGTGLSGLNAASKNLDVIGHNIANGNTTGMKAGRAEFSEMYASALGAAGGSNGGIGVAVATVSQLFTQGNLKVTGNDTDMAINGEGFFKVSMSDGSTAYTRNGEFKLDKNGYIVTNNGAKLQGYATDLKGTRTSVVTSSLQLPTSGVISPKATGTDPALTSSDGIFLSANLNAGAPIATLPLPSPLTAAYKGNGTALNVYDDQGNTIPMQVYFVKTAANTWSVISEVQPADKTLLATNVGTTSITFDGNGKPTTVPAITVTVPPGTYASGIPTIPVAPATGLTAVPIKVGDGTGAHPYTLTQFGSKFAINDLTQDGYSAGEMSGISIGENGLITAQYSNGTSQAAGQVGLTTFRNPQGLQPNNGGYWQSTSASGDPVQGAPQEGRFGQLRSGALEESNVDLTAELVNMIVAQRSYQANAQTIKTQDQVLSTLVNLR
ncbi:MAG: flagellar hook protein FlgE [Burkholderiales bacterium]|nr:flagellar hook protein FlgE [Burkholderiales bacterium]